MNTIIKYIKDTRAEFSHVTWPTKGQVIVATVAVVVISLVVGYMLGAFDVLFAWILEKIIL